jgi:hypothetical protein
MRLGHALNARNPGKIQSVPVPTVSRCTVRISEFNLDESRDELGILVFWYAGVRSQVSYPQQYRF